MNGTNRLYRSTSEAMVGGVAAGLANYFKTDPTIVRAAFVILTLLTGGAFIVPYLILWLLVPTAGSTATTPGGVVQENIDEVGAKLRGAWKVPGNGNPGNGNPGNGNPGNGGNGPTGSAPGNGNGSPGNSANFAASAETPGAAGSAPNGGPGTGYAIQTRNHQRIGLLPLILIVLGALVLFGHTSFFHIGFGFSFWPLVLIGLGMFLLARRSRWNG